MFRTSFFFRFSFIERVPSRESFFERVVGNTYGEIRNSLKERLTKKNFFKERKPKEKNLTQT